MSVAVPAAILPACMSSSIAERGNKAISNSAPASIAAFISRVRPNRIATLLPRSAIDELIQAGKIAAGTVTDVVRSLVGLMVRKGAPEPDIGSVEAFKSVLRQAKAISYSKGPSGLYVAELLQRLGLAAEMENKTVFAIGRPVGEVIARGEAEIGMQQIIENQPVAGAHLVGPLPAELINYVMYSAGFAPAAARGPGEAFIKFLASPPAASIIRAKGMEPA